MRANTFRRVALAAAGALVLALHPLPHAGAQGEAEPRSFTGDVASASWFLEDEKNTGVFVTAVDGDSHQPPGAPQEEQLIQVDVFQSFCDEAADELVERSFFGVADAPVEADNNLRAATADAELTLSGFEFRIPGCDTPALGGAVPVDLDEQTVTLASDWTGTGELSRSRNLFHLDTAGFKLRSRGSSRTRAATAEGSLAGLEAFDVPRNLGEAGFASLTAMHDGEVLIGDDPFPGPDDPAGPVPAPGPFPPPPGSSTDADHFAFRGDTAHADWLLPDDRNTWVSVSALDGDEHLGSGPPERLEEVSVSVFQSFCDEDTDEFVNINLLGSAEAPVTIDGDLGAAEAAADAVLTGTEFRMPGCAAPAFGEGTVTAVGPVTAGVDVGWQGDGPLSRSLSIFHFDSGDFKLRSRDRTEMRPAVAHATVSGLDAFAVPADLGASEFATLMSVNRGVVQIGEAPLPPPPG